uniref:Major facilitator superfamily (MFS) profile domain-containing protein n=1 Tax=Panagrolaimus sp. ES5 TaxID=591445 RepID=A0AC34FT52_9BILA
MGTNGAVYLPTTELLTKNDLNETSLKKLPLFHPLSRRLHMLLLMMIGFFTIVNMRINMGIAITCMVNSTAVTLDAISKQSFTTLDNNSSFLMQNNIPIENNELRKCSQTIDNSGGGEAIVNDYGGTLIWDTKVQGYIFSSIFYGSLITIIPGGYLADTQSPKTLTTIAGIIYIIITFVTPVIAVQGGWLPLFFARVIMGAGDGLVMPSINKLVTFWIPTEEKSTAASIYSTGFPLASILGVPTFAYLCSTSWGWPAIFYGCAILGVIWLILWHFAASKNPTECKVMSERERIYLKSKPELAVRHKTNGLFGAIPPMMEISFKFAWSIWMDRLKQRKVLSPTNACKLSQFCSGALVTILFTLLAYLPDCENPYVTLILFCLIALALSFSASGFFTSMLSIAPLFTGLISSATMVAGITARVITPLLVSYFNKTGRLEEWRPIFFVIAGTSAFSTVFFVLFSSAEVQPWARIPTNRMPSKLEMDELKKENEIEIDTMAADMLP